jgi:hypothetical protein
MLYENIMAGGWYMQNWLNGDWSYLLGVIHGDGNVSDRSIRICVGNKDADFADMIMSTWTALGFNPKLYHRRTALSVEVHDIALTNAIRKFKAGGKWSVPEDFDKGEWLAGVFDTDGCVSLTKSKCAVILGLKRSGNLLLVKSALSDVGIGNVNIRNCVSKFHGKPYPIEVLGLTSFDKIRKFSETVPLRHPRKKIRLNETLAHIIRAQSIVPLWKQVAKWLHEGPHTWPEIADKFSLTKRQVDSCLQMIKQYGNIEIIPPPRMLTKYLVAEAIK